MTRDGFLGEIGRPWGYSLCSVHPLRYSRVVFCMIFAFRSFSLISVVIVIVIYPIVSRRIMSTPVYVTFPNATPCLAMGCRNHQIRQTSIHIHQFDSQPSVRQIYISSFFGDGNPLRSAIGAEVFRDSLIQLLPEVESHASKTSRNPVMHHIAVLLSVMRYLMSGCRPYNPALDCNYQFS